MDFGMCNSTSGSQNDEVYRLGNTLRNTTSGYIPPFDGVYGPFCPTDSGWDAPLTSIDIPDQNDITFIYISGDIIIRDQDSLMEIGNNLFVSGYELIDHLPYYLSGKTNMIVSAKAYPDPLFGITRSAEYFSRSLAKNAHSETTQNMVWTRVNSFDEPTNQLITRIGGDSLCPITPGENHENPDGPYLFSDAFQDLLHFFAPGPG